MGLEERQVLEDKQSAAHEVGKHQPSRMSLPYELSCLGQIPASDPGLLEALQNSLRQHFQIVEPFETCEYLFLKEDSSIRQGHTSARDEEFLRLRRSTYGPESSTKDAPWCLHSMHPPIRDQHAALCRSYSNVKLSEASERDARRFISALGFKPKSNLMRKGLQYIHGSVTVSIFQLYHVDAPERALLPQVYLVEAVNLISLPSPNTKGLPPQQASETSKPQAQAQPAQVLAQGLDVIKEVKAMLKGIVTLQKVEPAH